MYRKLLLTLSTALLVLSSNAQNFQFPNPTYLAQKVNSSSIASYGLYPYAMTPAEDIYYSALTSATPANGSFKSVVDYVSVGVRSDTPVIIAKYKYRVTLSLGCKIYPAGTNTPKTITLDFSYDPDSLKSYADLAVYKFSGYHHMDVQITKVEDISSGSPVLVSATALAKNFYIETGVITSKYDAPSSISINTQGNYISNTNTLRISWGTGANFSNDIQPLEYELEWTYIDNYHYNLSTHSATNSFPTNISYDFRKNATRVRLKQNIFEIPMVYEQGAIVYRVRYIRPDNNNSYKDGIYGTWTLSDLGTLNASDYSHIYIISSPHMGDKLNWQYTVNFAEDGKYKHVINYFDGSLRGRQTQTKINTDNNYVIAVDKTYDYEGRPAIQSLPSPVFQSYLSYRDDIVRVGSSRPYAPADYDRLSCNLPDSLLPVTPASIAGQYYSSSNLYKAWSPMQFVPDAKGYPIIQSIYSPDNLLTWQGGAGLDHQLWRNRGTKYEYTQPMDGELNKYFGTEIGASANYTKKMTTDPNRQTSFVISNPAGKPVATGLVGYPDLVGTPLEMINGIDTNSMTTNILNGAIQKNTGTGLIANKRFYMEANSPDTIKYTATIPAYTIGCTNGNVSVLARAKYSYSATDDCGNAAIPNTSGILGLDSVVTSIPGGFGVYNAPAIMAQLTKGNYTADKSLVFDPNEVSSRMKQGIKKLEQLGCSPDEKSFIRQAVENANLPCITDNSTDACGGRKAKMMQELWPNAKYGQYKKNSDGSFAYDTVCIRPSGDFVYVQQLPDNPNSIFSAIQTCSTMVATCVLSIVGNPLQTVNPSCFHPRYLESCITLPASVTKNGRVYTNLASLPIDTFIYIFNDAIAEALLPLHPEYCKLQYCDDGEYIEQLKAFTTQKQAVQGHRFLLDDIVTNDPLYIKASATDKPGIMQRLSHMTNYSDKRIDQIAFEQAYGAAGNGPELQHNVKFLYATTITQGKFLDSTVKQTYFDVEKNFYLGNRSYILQKALDSTANTCSPCTTNRMTLIDPAVFPHIFSSNSNTIASDVNMPDWMKTVFNNAMDPNYNPSNFNPPPTQVNDSINRGKDSITSGRIDAIVHDLNNCSLSSDTINQIRTRLLYYTGQGVELTPDIVKTVLTDVHVPLTDLCNSFLTTYNISNEPDYTYDCGRPEVYAGIKEFLSDPAVVTAIETAAYTGSANNTVTLNAVNAFENKIATTLGLSTMGDQVIVQGYLDTIKTSATTFLKFIRLKVTKPNTSNSIYFFLKRKVSSSPYLDGATAITTNAVSCLNDDDGMNTGYAAQYTAVIDFYLNGNNTNLYRYYLWSSNIPIMVNPTGKLPLACVTCVDIKNALKAFKTDKVNYNYDNASNHPFFDQVLTNYLNNKLKKHYSYYEYTNLMKGCAVGDSIELPRHYGIMKFQCNSDAIADTINDRMLRYSSRLIIDSRIKYYGAGYTLIAVDLGVVPFDSMLRYRNDLITIAINAGATVTYLPNEPLRVLRSMACQPVPYITSYGSFSKDKADVYSGKKVIYTDSVFTYTGTYANALAHANLLASMKSYISTCSNSMLLYDAEPLRSDDYAVSQKQDYLSYVYAQDGKSRIDIRDSIDTYNIKYRLTGMASQDLKYDDPACGLDKHDLYITTSSQNTYVGSQRLNSVLTAVYGSLSSYKLFLPDNSISQTVNTNLKIYRKQNGTHWYRLFETGNNLYNVYLEPPLNGPFSPNTLLLDSVRIGPGTDSIYRFTAYMHYNGIAQEVIPCRGYTDFPLGYGQQLKDVVLYHKPGDQVCIDSLDCEHNALIDAIYAGKARYGFYFDSTVAWHSSKMFKYLLDNTTETLTVSAKNAKNMVTLYYYDLSGNLERTVPPQGVDKSGNAAHTKVTKYTYDSRNLLRMQQTPDGGVTTFYYDAVGRLAFSQNDKQKALGRFSYTLYDDLSRPYETGEVQLTTANGAPPSYVSNVYNDNLYQNSTLAGYVRTQTRYDVVRTTYDVMKVDLGNIANENLSTQENLISRVSTVSYYLSKAADYTPVTEPVPQFETYYSYDAVGNVKTVSYNCPNMQPSKQQYKRVDYDYDQISGKVNMISYNRGRPDQFYQRYSYDADNRITMAETSNDGMVWNRDATYTYYVHGPLANIKIGNNQIQSLDYAYTIQGWLKAINGDVLRTDKQMQPDGAVGDVTYARDAIAHTIDYFNGDYQPINSTANGFNLSGPAKGYYNGNIARTTTAIRGVSNSSGTNDNMRASYIYDQAQRIIKTAYESINETALSATATNKFTNNYKYDLDGNLQNLTRYNGAATPVKIDSIMYNYTTNTNKLAYANDLQGNVSGGTDFKTGQVAGNYTYDAIGNMTQDNQGKVKMDWNLYGKLKTVTFIGSSPAQVLNYEYDGHGNRVRKDMVTTFADGSEDHRGEYYVRDASGNMLAVYKFCRAYSKISLIIAADHDIYHNPYFPGFVNAQAMSGTFVQRFSDKAISVTPGWANSQTAKPISFYLDNNTSLYSNMIAGSQAADYLNDLQVYDGSENSQILSGALITDQADANNILIEILNHPETGPIMLTHFDTDMPAPSLNQMWMQLGIEQPRDPVNHTANANTLYNRVQMGMTPPPVLVSNMQMIITNPGNAPQSQTFYNNTMQDNQVFRSPALQQTPNFKNLMQNVVLIAADKATQVEPFLNQWTGSTSWLNAHTTLSGRMQTVYNADANGVLASWLSTTSTPQALDTVLGQTDALVLGNYLNARVNNANFNNINLAQIYAMAEVTDTASLAEHDIYGSSRLGVQNYKDSLYRQTYNINTAIAPTNGLNRKAVWYDPRYNELIDSNYKDPFGHGFTGELYLSRTLGYRNYEMTDHLGSVLATVLDRKTGHNPGGGATKYDYYLPDVSSAQGYYPFGQRMKEWNNEISDSAYRFGYNGKLKDDEVYGRFNFEDYGERKYNPLLARFVSIDPLTRKYPMLTPYQFASNSPISGIDLDGLEFYYTASGSLLGKIGVSTDVRIVNSADVKGVSGYITWANNTEISKNAAYAVNQANKLSTSMGTSNNQLVAFAAVVDQESGGSKNESYAIANVTMNFISEGGSVQLKTLDDVTMYDNTFAQGARQDVYTNFTIKTPAQQNSKYALGAAINAIGYSKGLKGFSDYSEGADSWDGRDLIFTNWTNSHRDYSWSEDSKDLLSTYKKDNNGGVDVSLWSYKKSGYDIRATKIIGKTIFTNLQGGRGEKKQSTEKFK